MGCITFSALIFGAVLFILASSFHHKAEKDSPARQLFKGEKSSLAELY